MSEDIFGGEVYFEDDNLPVLRKAEGIGCTNTPSVKIDIRADDNDGIGLSHAYVEESGYDPTTIYFSSCELSLVTGEELIHYYRCPYTYKNVAQGQVSTAYVTHVVDLS